MKQIGILLAGMIMATSLWAQQNVTLSGYMKDAATGEELIGATVYLEEAGAGGATNVYGFYSITVPADTYTVTYQYVGYASQQQTVVLTDDKTLNIELEESAEQLETVEVTSERATKNIESVEMSTTKLQMETIKKIPAIFGEVDLVKTMQLLPGIVSAGEGTGGFYVRGGGVDQNMILLDEAPVYNASHLLGFFSVFNSDAIKDVKVYKGGIPAEYGGRLSSVLDVRMKDGNSKKFSMSGGIGTISSRLTLEGPIVKDKASFIVSARRTYADVFLKLSRDEELRKNKLFFYDINAKINWRISEKDRLYASGYFGRDVFRFGDEFFTEWGNATATLRWNHLFNDKLFKNTTFIFSKFNYSLGVPSGTQAFDWDADIQDFSLKQDYTWYISPDNTFKWGFVATHHKFNPASVKPTGDQDESIFNSFSVPAKRAVEGAAYLSMEQNFGEHVTVQYGLRYSLFWNVGKGQQFVYGDGMQEAPTDTLFFDRFEGINTYHGPEPRASVNFKINKQNSIKINYMMTRQYLHLISGSSVTTPLDIWVPADPYIKPGISNQVAAGYFRNFWDNKLEASVEVYYKKQTQLVDYIDNAELLLNDKIETQLLEGEGYSYGAEFLLRKQTGRFTGWISYAISKTRRKVPGINDGDYYPAVYDRTHDVAVVVSFDINEYLNIAANWVYTTGVAATFPAGRFEYNGVVAPVFTSRNDFRLPAYHRGDISLTYKFRHKRKPNRRWRSELNFSIYNVYFRKNAFSVTFEQDPNTNVTKAYKTFLFPILPSLTYNFTF